MYLRFSFHLVLGQLMSLELGQCIKSLSTYVLKIWVYLGCKIISLNILYK